MTKTQPAVNVGTRGHIDHDKAVSGETSRVEHVISRHGVGGYCHPVDDQRQRWMLIYEDHDAPNGIYYDEQEAWTAFERAEGRGWNCHLLTSVPRIAAY